MKLSFFKKKKAAEPPPKPAAVPPLKLVPQAGPPTPVPKPAVPTPALPPTAAVPETIEAVSPGDATLPAFDISNSNIKIDLGGIPGVTSIPGAPPLPAKAGVPPEFTPPATPTPQGLAPTIIQARAFRVAISPLHRLHFVPADPILKGRENARLCNISISGVGLVATDFIRQPALKDVFRGSLFFDSGSHPVELQVMHLTSGVIGAKFHGDVAAVREAIKKYFELELLAVGMLKVNPAHHKADADGNAHWIHGDQCELFYVMDAAGKLVRFRLTFTGNRFVWSKTAGLSVGQVVDDRVGIMRTDRIAVMETSPELIELALRFLHNIPQIPQGDREQICTAVSPDHQLKA
jgi:hypothetical protein